MELITRTDYDLAAQTNPVYYLNRWPYIAEVLRFLQQLEVKTALEIGPYLLPMYRGGDIMDKNPDKLPGKHTFTTSIIHDATQTPWPVVDKAYDVLVALQVWEHLDTNPINYQAYCKRKDAFAEAMRVSKAAVLSFPYKWHAPGNHHHGIDEKKIEEWTLGLAPKARHLCVPGPEAFRGVFFKDDFEKMVITNNNPYYQARIIYFWEF